MQFVSRCITMLVVMLPFSLLLSAQQICDKPGQIPCVNQPHAGDKQVTGKLPPGSDKLKGVKITVTVNETEAGDADINMSEGTFAKSVDPLSVYDTVIVKQTAGIPVMTPTTVQVGAPTAAQTAESSDFDLVLGVGSLIVKGDVTDYKNNTQNSVLQTTNLGRATPQLLTGAAFKLPFGNFTKGAADRFGKRPWYAFLSLKFSPESSQTFSGYVIGGSYKLSKGFSILAGYALTPLQEPSPGFRIAASQVVQQNPNLPIYQRFDAAALLANRQNAFDGFPLFVQAATGPTTTRVFDGNPTVVHYHGGFVIGIAVPISIKAALGGGNAK